MEINTYHIFTDFCVDQALGWVRSTDIHTQFSTITPHSVECARLTHLNKIQNMCENESKSAMTMTMTDDRQACNV